MNPFTSWIGTLVGWWEAFCQWPEAGRLSLVKTKLPRVKTPLVWLLQEPCSASRTEHVLPHESSHGNWGGCCETEFCTTNLSSVIKPQTLCCKNISVMNNKGEAYFNLQETLTAWLAVAVGCDPKPFNVNGYLSAHFSGADPHGPWLWFILISHVQYSSAEGRE